MQYPHGKGITGGHWLPNMLLEDSDINFISESQYTNFLISAISSISSGFTSGRSRVLRGMEIYVNSLMTLKLTAGASLSSEGYYLSPDGTWEFVDSEGDFFGVVIPSDTLVAIQNADPTNPRIDIIEIRPIRLNDNQKNRQFKDPITGLITTSLMNTRYTYSYEFHVISGTPMASPVAPSKTDGWIKLAEISVASGVTSLSNVDILTYNGSSAWTTDSYSTYPPDTNTNIYISLLEDYDDTLRQMSLIPSDLKGRNVIVAISISSGSVVTYPETLSFDINNGNIHFNYSGFNSKISASTGLLFDITCDNANVLFDSGIYFDSVKLSNSNNNSTVTFRSGYTPYINDASTDTPAIEVSGFSQVNFGASFSNNINVVSGKLTNFLYFTNCIHISKIPTMKLHYTDVDYLMYLNYCTVAGIALEYAYNTTKVLNPESSMYSILDGIPLLKYPTSGDLTINTVNYITSLGLTYSLPEITPPPKNLVYRRYSSLEILMNATQTNYHISQPDKSIMNYNGSLSTEGTSGGAYITCPSVKLIPEFEPISGTWANDIGNCPTNEVSINDASTYVAGRASDYNGQVVNISTGHPYNTPAASNSGLATHASYTNAGDMFAVSYTDSPYIKCYTQSGDTFTDYPVNNLVESVALIAIAQDLTLLAVVYTSDLSKIHFFENTGSAFTDYGSVWDSGVDIRDITFSSNHRFIVGFTNGTATVIRYSGTSYFTEGTVNIALSPGNATSSAGMLFFSRDDKYFYALDNHPTGNNWQVFERSGRVDKTGLLIPTGIKRAIFYSGSEYIVADGGDIYHFNGTSYELVDSFSTSIYHRDSVSANGLYRTHDGNTYERVDGYDRIKWNMIKQSPDGSITLS